METLTTTTMDRETESLHAATHAGWVTKVALLWMHRRTLAKAGAISFIASLVLSCVIPKQYKSSASIMPPDNSGSGALMLAALSGHASGLGGLGSLAGSLLGTHSSTALFIDLLKSGTVTGDLITRFDLQHVYHKRYRADTAKYLLRQTSIVEDKKSGVITISVRDRDRYRARDMVQAYLDELNKLMLRTNTSSGHQERIFIEKRLNAVKNDLETAQVKLGQFSSTHTTLDIKEQTRAMVDTGAKLQAQLLVDQSELGSLRQIYGDSNLRVRAAEARIATLQKELSAMSGNSAPLQPDAEGADDDAAKGSGNELYPPLRQLPRLAVPFADLYRQVKVQETVYELLTQQYELARLQEAKDVPVISVIDSPGVAEKKSFPPRTILTLALTLLSLTAVSFFIVLRERWADVDSLDPRKQLWSSVRGVMVDRLRRHSPRGLTQGAEAR